MTTQALRGMDPAQIDAAYAAAALGAESTRSDATPLRIISIGCLEAAEHLAKMVRGEIVDEASIHSAGDLPASGLAIVIGRIERLDEAEIDAALARLRRIAPRAYLHVSTIPADAHDADGLNLHRTVRSAEWWLDRVAAAYGQATRLRPERFELARIVTWTLDPEAERSVEILSKRLARRRRRQRVLRRIKEYLLRIVHPTRSTPQVLRQAKELRIAVVGNAAGLSGRAHGAAIDDADIVIRFNRMPIVSTKSHGSRTDWLATSLRDFDPSLLDARAPRLVIWTGGSGKNIHDFPSSARRDLHAVDRSDWLRLKRAIGRKPSAGLIVIDLLARSEASDVALYGFDFNATPSLSGARLPDKEAHDFAAEAAYVRDLIARDARFRIVS